MGEGGEGEGRDVRVVDEDIQFPVDELADFVATGCYAGFVGHLQSYGAHALFS